jgi:GT2 family glycosyltransferase
VIENVDIIITTKNRIADLLITIKQMISIGFKEEQFFIVDDGSSDGTFMMVKNEFPKINISRNENSLGYMENRSNMMQHSRNDFVLSIDDDSNLLSKEDIQEAITILKSDAQYGIFHFRVFNQLMPPPPKSQLADKFRILRGYIGCGHLIKKELIEKIGRYRKELVFYCEELDYSLRALKVGYKVVSKDNLIVYHRIDLELRQKQKNTQSNKGIYGREWRNIHLYSNNLIITALYYPFFLDLFFLGYRMMLAFYLMVLKEKQLTGYFKMLARFLSFIPYIFRESQKLNYSAFKDWFNCPDMTDSNSTEN